jgi:hypothetical protein
MAAVLACHGSALSRYSAGALDGYLTWDNRLPEVTVVGSAGRSRPGLRIHRTRTLDERDVRRNLTIPRTTVARTLLDLADDMPDAALRRAVRQAQAMNLTNVRLVADVLTRANGRRGAQRLAAPADARAVGGGGCALH